MDKRTFLKVTAVTSAGLLTLPSLSYSALNDNLHEFNLPELPFAYDALEPYIDARTMELHHSKHHAGYTANFNKAVTENNLTGKSIEGIFKRISTLPVSIRNNGGGYYNHKLFWEFLTPSKTNPSSELTYAINEQFGTIDKMKEEFSKKAVSVFGSGWAWLVKDADNKLIISTTSNQDNPLMDIAEVKGKPVLTIDVWEHAYYLKYQNRRKEYIDAFWNVVNWEKVSELYAG